MQHVQLVPSACCCWPGAVCSPSRGCQTTGPQRLFRPSHPPVEKTVEHRHRGGHGRHCCKQRLCNSARSVKGPSSRIKAPLPQRQFAAQLQRLCTPAAEEAARLLLLQRQQMNKGHRKGGEQESLLPLLARRAKAPAMQSRGPSVLGAWPPPGGGMRTPLEAVRFGADRPCPTSGRSPVPDAKALPVWGRPLASGGAVSPASAVACGRRAAHQVTTSCPVYKRKGAFAFTSRGNVRSLHPGLCGTCMPFNV